MKNILKQIPPVIAIKLDVEPGELFHKNVVHEFECRDYSFELCIVAYGSVIPVVSKTYDNPSYGGEIETDEIEFDSIKIWDSNGDEINLSAEELYSVQMEIENSIVFE